MNPPAIVERPPEPVASAEPITYYGLPVIKQPVWIWTVPVYFFVGGVAGSAMVLGAVAQSADRRRTDEFAQLCHWTGAIGGAISSVLLITDLGRPSRFLNMLRVLRPSSPMSLGSWTLALATPLAGMSAVLARTHGARYALARAAGIGAGILGMPLATYTAVLLTHSSVPVWLATRQSLPFLFGASSAASLASVLELMPLGRSERAVVRRFGIMGRAADVIASRVVENHACSNPHVGAPLKRGLSATLWRAAGVFTAASLLLSLLPGESRFRRRASGILGIAGGLALRLAVFHAGKASARDPRATFSQQA